MNIVFSSDDNYARHLAASMTSIMENNREEELIHIWILNVGLSRDNIEKLTEVVEKYCRVIHIVDFSDICQRLNSESIPLGSFTIEMYTRLFIADALPVTEHRAMWIDGDTSVLGCIHDLYYCDLHGCAAAAVVDQPNFGLEVSIKDAEIPNGPYFASGMFLADLDVWREKHISAQFVAYLSQRDKATLFPDQCLFNHVLYGRIHKLPFAFHVVTPTFFLTYRQMCKRWGKAYYKKEEYIEGKRHPLIVHYTLFRPWKRWCLHPMKRYYRHYLKLTPYKDVPLENEGIIKTFDWICTAVFSRVKRLFGN